MCSSIILLESSLTSAAEKISLTVLLTEPFVTGIATSYEYHFKDAFDCDDVKQDDDGSCTLQLVMTLKSSMSSNARDKNVKM